MKPSCIGYSIATPHFMYVPPRTDSSVESNERLLLCASSNKIKHWWTTHTQMDALRKVYNCVKTALTNDDLQRLSNTCNELKNVCKGDGAGLLGGALTDMLLSKYFSEKIEHYIESHSGESDMKIYGIAVSLKKINGKSTIALNWSKNNVMAALNITPRFNSHIMIINLRSQRWWKTKPTKLQMQNAYTRVKAKDIEYNAEIKSGIYLIDKQYCKRYTQLSSNNKTNTLINSTFLYCMLQRSVQMGMWIELPAPNKTITFNILHAFSE